MAQANLGSKKVTVNTSNDSVVIVQNLSDLPGGRTLNVDGFADKVIHAGHTVIQDDVSKEYKPIPVDGKLPAQHEVIGIVVATTRVSNAQVGIMLRGTVNEAYAKYPYKPFVKKALEQVNFIKE